MKTYISLFPCIRWNVAHKYKRRTLATIRKCGGNPEKTHMGCIWPPLLNIDVDEMIVDELHMMLRVSDVLLRNLIWAMMYRDMEWRRNTHKDHQNI